MFNISGAMTVTAAGIAVIGWDFLFSVIISHISEELMFRGIILNSLNKKLPLVAAILISSILFSLMHSYEV